MQKQLLLGVEAIAQEPLTAEFQAYMPIPVLLRQKSPNIFRILKRLSPVMYTGMGSQRKDGHGIGFGNVLRRQKSLGMYETRRYECGSRLLHECSYYRS